MTEAMYMMAISQVQFVTSVEQTVLTAIDKANNKKCSECRALKHADEVEEQKKQEELIRRLKLAHGIKDDPDKLTEYDFVVFSGNKKDFNCS